MPINNLTTNVIHAPTRGLPCIGRLFKGEPKPETGNRPGKELDYFRVDFANDTPEQQQQAADILTPAWNMLYGEHAREISGVIVMSDDVDITFPTWNESYGGSGLKIRCDGVTQKKWRSEDGTMHSEPRQCMKDQGCECKEHGTLYFLLPRFSEVTGIFGYFSLSTHSVNDIIYIYQALRNTQNAFGGLLNVPFVLRREPREFQITTKDKEGKNRQSKTTKILCTLNLMPNFVKAAANAIAPNLQLQLAAKSLDDDESQEGLPEEPRRGTEPLHWFNDPELLPDSNLTKKEFYFNRLKELGINPKELPGMVYDYPTVRDALETLMDARGLLPADYWEKKKAAQQQSQAIEGNEPPEESESAAESDDDPIEATEIADDNAAFVFSIGRLCDEFNKTNAEMLAAFDAKNWTELGKDVAEIKQTIIERAETEHWPVVVHECAYSRLPAPHITFITSVGDFSLKIGLTGFAAQFKDTEDKDLVMKWRDGNHKLPAPLLIHWLERDGFKSISTFEELSA